MKKLLFIFGTRPEAIKMIPLIHACKTANQFQVKICITAQHREMLDQILSLFNISIDYDLNCMQPNQDLSTLSASLLLKLKEVLMKESPHLILVQGDTTTAMIAALSAFYQKIPIAHIEAGLRTYNSYSPFPEEINRQLISKLATYHFAPTKQNKENLLKENVSEENIYVTGNTGIDFLRESLQMNYSSENLAWAQDKRLLILTTHRRENIGQNMENIFNAVKKIANTYPEIRIIYPVHKNPQVSNLAYNLLTNCPQIRLTPPLNPIEFQHLLAKAYLILTDSGGIQEEATYLGKPVLVLRNNTERIEGIENGNSKLIGTNTQEIFNEVKNLLNNSQYYKSRCKKSTIYWKQNSSNKIANILVHLVNCFA